MCHALERSKHNRWSCVVGVQFVLKLSPVVVGGHQCEKQFTLDKNGPSGRFVTIRLTIGVIDLSLRLVEECFKNCANSPESDWITNWSIYFKFGFFFTFQYINHHFPWNDEQPCCCYWRSYFFGGPQLVRLEDPEATNRGASAENSEGDPAGRRQPSAVCFAFWWIELPATERVTRVPHLVSSTTFEYTGTSIYVMGCGVRK